MSSIASTSLVRTQSMCNLQEPSSKRQKTLSSVEKIVKLSQQLLTSDIETLEAQKNLRELIQVAKTLKSDHEMQRIVFGKTKWEKYFGPVGFEPPLPPSIMEILTSPCPFWKGKKVHETHTLTLLPLTVNGLPLTLDSLQKLSKNTKNENETFNFEYDSIVEKVLDEVPASYWVLMTRDVIPGSQNLTYDDQINLIDSSYADEGYELPNCLELVISIFMDSVHSGKKLYNNTAHCTYARCQEVINEKWPVAVGFDKKNLKVLGKRGNDKIESDGIRAVRIF